MMLSLLLLLVAPSMAETEDTATCRKYETGFEDVVYATDGLHIPTNGFFFVLWAPTEYRASCLDRANLRVDEVLEATDTGVVESSFLAGFDVDHYRYYGQLPSQPPEEEPATDVVVDVPDTGIITLRIGPSQGYIPAAEPEFFDVARGDGPASTTPATVVLDDALWERAGRLNDSRIIDVVAELKGLSFDETGVVVLKHGDHVVGLTRYSGESSLTLQAHQFTADPGLVCITAEVWNLAGETVGQSAPTCEDYSDQGCHSGPGAPTWTWALALLGLRRRRQEHRHA